MKRKITFSLLCFFLSFITYAEPIKKFNIDKPKIFKYGETEDSTLKINSTADLDDCDYSDMPISNSVYLSYVKVSTAVPFEVNSLNEGYLNNTTDILTIIPGEKYRFNLGVVNLATGGARALYVWIDFNQDGDFDDDGERVVDFRPGNNSSLDLQFSNKLIPASATLGETKMRVLVRDTNVVTPPCGVSIEGEGEVEDYQVLITDGSALSIKNTQNNDFSVKLWPNPSRKDFNVNLQSNNTPGLINIDIYDVLGELVHKKMFNKNEIYQFGAQLVAGVYIVKLSQGRIQQTFKLVKSE